MNQNKSIFLKKYSQSKKKLKIKRIGIKYDRKKLKDDEIVTKKLI
jgi:hypothetical protein